MNGGTEPIRTLWFEWSGWWRWRCLMDAGVGHLQVPGLLQTRIFPKHPLSDGNLAGTLVLTAAVKQNGGR